MSEEYTGKISEPLPLAQVWERGALTTGPSEVELLRGVCSRAITNLIASPITSVLTTVTISCVLSVFAVMMFLFENLKAKVETNSGQAELNVFIKEGASESEVRILSTDLANFPGVEKVTYITKTEALKRFKDMLGKDSELANGLEADNPLPASYNVTFKSKNEPEKELSNLKEKLQSDSRIESVSGNDGILAQFQGAITLLRFFSIGAGFVFFLIGVAIIYNTIRLALFAHRQEIEVMELMGARPQAIQAPYLIEGMIHGIFGSLFASVIIAIMYSLMKEAHERSEVAKLFIPELVFLSSSTLLLLTFIGVFIGALGSYVAVKRFLERE